MAKPKRKYPVFRIIDSSPQQGQFTDAILRVVGRPAVFEPLELMRNGAHVFLLHGDRGWGFFVEPRGDGAEGGIWLQRYAFLQMHPQAGPRLHARFTSHHWDPWTEAAETGDTSITSGPRKKLYALRDERNRQLAVERDESTIDWLIGKQGPEAVCDVPFAELLGLVAKHHLDERFAFPAPPL